MPLPWNAAEPHALDQLAAAQALGVEPGALTEAGGWFRAWRRDGGPHAGHAEPPDEEVLQLHLAVSRADPEGYRVLAVWSHELRGRDERHLWYAGPFPWPDLDRADHPDAFDLYAALARVDPLSPHLPATCPAWRWTAEDVRQYRQLANTQSAYRWLHEQGISVTTAGHMRWYDGREVVIKAAAMRGRGRGGGRPRTTPSSEQ